MLFSFSHYRNFIFLIIIELCCVLKQDGHVAKKTDDANFGHGVDDATDKLEVSTVEKTNPNANSQVNAPDTSNQNNVLLQVIQEMKNEMWAMQNKTSAMENKMSAMESKMCSMQNEIKQLKVSRGQTQAVIGSVMEKEKNDTIAPARYAQFMEQVPEVGFAKVQADMSDGSFLPDFQVRLYVTKHHCICMLVSILLHISYFNPMLR